MKTLHKKINFSAMGLFLASVVIFQQGVLAQEGLIFQKKLETEPSNTQILEAKKMLVEKANTPGGIIGAYELGLHQFKGTYNIRTSASAASSANIDGQGTLGQLATIVEVTNIIYTYSNGEKHPWVKIKYEANGVEKTNYVIGNALEKVKFNFNIKKYATGGSASNFVYRDSDLQYNVCAVEDSTKKDCPASNVEPGNVDSYIVAAENKAAFDLDISKLLSGKQDPHKINKVYIATEIFYSDGNKRNNFTISYSNKVWKFEGGNKDLVYNTTDKKWRFTVGGTPIGETPDVVNEDPEKIDQVAGFPFTSTSITAGSNGNYTVVGKLKISLMNITLGAAAEREVQFTVDNKACLVGGEINFTNSQAGNWEVQGNWFSSQLLISFNKLVATTCTTGYFQGNLSLNSQATLPYINGEKKFSAAVRLNKEGRLYDPANPSLGPSLTQTGTPISELHGYGFTVNSVRLSNSLANKFDFSGILKIPNSSSASIDKTVEISGTNSVVTTGEISFSSSDLKYSNIELKVNKAKFSQIQGTERLVLMGQIKLGGVFKNKFQPMTGVGVSSNGNLLPTVGVLGSTWISESAFGGTIKIRNADLVKDAVEDHFDIRGEGKLSYGPTILGVKLTSSEVTIPEIQLNYQSDDGRFKLDIDSKLSIPNAPPLTLSQIFSFKSNKVEFEEQEVSGKKVDAIKISTGLSSAFDWLKLLKKGPKNMPDSEAFSIAISINENGTTKLSELALKFALYKGDNSDDAFIDAELTYKNGVVEGKISGTWLPGELEVGVSFSPNFMFYVGFSIGIDKLPLKFASKIGKVLGKFAPINSVSLKIGYWKPEGADQRRAFIEIGAEFYIPPLPIVTVNGKLLLGFSWESAYRIDVEAELSAKIKSDLLSDLISMGDLNLGKVNIKLFVDITNGDFGFDLEAAVGPDLQVASLKLEAKARVNFSIGYANGSFRFYYDTSLNTKLELDYQSTPIDIGFRFEAALGVAFGRNNPVKLYMPVDLSSMMKRHANLTMPTTLNATGGFIFYAYAGIHFWIDIPLFDKWTWTRQLGLYIQYINKAVTAYVGLEFSDTILGDPVEYRIHGIRKANGQFAFVVDIWDKVKKSTWEKFEFETKVKGI